MPGSVLHASFTVADVVFEPRAIPQVVRTIVEVAAILAFLDRYDRLSEGDEVVIALLGGPHELGAHIVHGRADGLRNVLEILGIIRDLIAVLVHGRRHEPFLIAGPERR